MSTTATTQVVMQPALDVKVARENTIALTPTGGRGSAEAVAMAGGPPDAPPDALMGRRNGPLANQPTNSRPALREVASLQSPGHGPLGPAGQVHLLQTASARFDPVITGRTELRKPAAM